MLYNLKAILIACLIICLLIIGSVDLVNGARGCIYQKLKNAKGSVCTCNITHCDSIEGIGSLGLDSAALFISTDDNSSSFGYRMDRIDDILFTNTPPSGNIYSLSINRSVTFQKIMGFGGAFTDAATYNINRLNKPELITSLLSSYYGLNGSEYNWGRIPIASADFSFSSYSYDDHPNDFQLTYFDTSMDDAYKVPIIKQAMSLSSRKISFFASAWSAPSWLKTSNSSTGGSINGNSSNPNDPAFNFWAQYYSNFIDAYNKKGININAITTQNEPYQTVKWDSDLFNVTTMTDWISLHLGPLFAKNHPQVSIIAHDDQRDILVNNMKAVLSNPLARQYIKGIGVHWYADVNDLFNRFGEMTKIHDLYNDLFILPTEACMGYLPWEVKVSLGDFSRALTYAYDIINDLLNYAAGWIDWNLALDMTGGPNHANNQVDSAIIVDDSGSMYYKQPMYYSLAHFSKFITMDSVRISTGPVPKNMKSLVVAFQSPVVTSSGGDIGSSNIVIVILNDSTAKETLSFYDQVKNGWIQVQAPPKSIQTIVYKA